MKLGTLLLRDGVINLDQLEAALRQQVLFGGRLGSNLVELGHISLDTLAIYLGKSLNMPAAVRDMLENADPEAIRSLPGPLAAAHTSFPFGFEVAGDERLLQVAMVDPRDSAGIEAMGRHAGLRIKPYIAGELRVFHYLDRHYGVKKTSALFAVVARSPRPLKRAATPLPFPGQSKSVRISPRLRPQTPFSAPVAQAPEITLTDALRDLETTATREEIGAGALRFCRGRFHAALLFIVKDRIALPWKGFVEGKDLDRLESAGIRLDEPSFLSAAHDSVRAWRGHPGLDTRVAELLRLPASTAEAFVAPVAIGARVVNLIYLHGGALDTLADGIETLAEAMSKAYARLIQAARR